MKNRIKKLMLWATVLAMLLTGMSAALADTQSATFVLQVRPKPTEAPAATDVPAAQAPATEAPATKAPATKAPELTYEEDEVASPVRATFQKNADGSLILDANGDPIPVIPEGAEVPVAYQRDVNGQLVLDANGDPIVTETLPAGSSMIASIYDQLDPDRRIDIYVSYEGEELDFGVEATLTAVPKGYEAVIYTLQWQTSKDDVTWEDIPGATEAQYTVTVTEENYMDYWRVLVIIDEAQ